MRGGVLVVERVGVAELIAEDGLAPVDLALDGLGVGIEQQLARVEPLALCGGVLAVDAVAVPLPGEDVGEIGVPDERVDVDQFEARLRPVLVEQAQLDLLRPLAEEGEIRPVTVVGGPEGIAGSWP
ncbi:aspartate/tyrosine/aromatic aminotransferase [Microbacterium testaceum StLB037]|uniref:Aspartate/tyrosine/aromatic aminotransferase n=1 Tax=Microbacterium testaceum (strain StLB037) TaxID=979556 RepID=E8NFT1_MICTS|nr:aspartate/tyrosine/aromatic aminotransferase [Microbacterium testaceum StLB037]